MNFNFFKYYLLLFIFTFSGYQILYAQLFAEQTGAISLTSEYYRSLQWGDYDNDSDLDLLVSCSSYPNYKTKVLKNNGNNTFTEDMGVILPGLNSGNSLWLDYDNDGYLDVLLSGNSEQGALCNIFRNNGNGNFSERVNIPVSNFNNIQTLVYDYDSDGDIDIFTYFFKQGTFENNYQDQIVVKIQENCGNDLFFEKEVTTFLGVRSAIVRVVDYDNDGNPDLSILGDNYSVGTLKLFKNSGEGVFEEETSIVFPSFSYARMAWADYNNDGNMDILINGYLNNVPTTKIYKNIGGGTFTEQTDIQLNIQGVNSIDWGDYNSDGYLDLFVYQGNSTETVLKVFINNSGNNFTEELGISLPNTQFGTLSWGDFDKDNKLDFVLSGYILGPVTKLYKNIDANINTVPSVPSNLKTNILNHGVNIGWDNSTDGMADPAGLTYNIYLSTISNKETLKPSMSKISDGFRKVAQEGNNTHRTQATIFKLNGGETYYWSVQAIDNSFAGGAFAPEQSFSIPIIRPDLQASSIVQTDGALTSIDVEWVNGNSTKRVVFMSEITSGVNFPSDNTSYTPDVQFGLGSEIPGSGMFCVYNGTENRARVTGLKTATIYKVYVFEYDGTPGNELYNISVGGNNINEVETSYFEEQTDISLPIGPYKSNAAWGDFDNDNDMDIIITGQGPNTKVFRNIGSNTFTETTSFSGMASLRPSPWGDFNNDGNLDLILNGSSTNHTFLYINKDDNFTQQTELEGFSSTFGSCLTWGDYDNDGDLDLLVSYNWYGGLIYKNNGDSTFIKQEQLLPQIKSVPGPVLWADINNDGYLDIIISGGGSGSPFFTIFKNNSGTSFTELSNTGITPVLFSSLSLGDYNSDGYLDVLITGQSDSGSISKVFKNNGDETFTENVFCKLTGVVNGSSEWGDYDNDGDLDLLVSGSLSAWGGEVMTTIYKNQGNDNFIKLVADKLPGISDGSISWGDYDNDGDLDLLITGNNNYGQITKVYKNISKNNNTPPTPPNNLQNFIEGNNVMLRWDKSLDNETPQNGLSYNIYISTQSLKENIKSGMSNILDGYRKITAMGNASINNFYTIKGLISGQTYFWSVQAIDNTFKGGSFASEHSFVMPISRPDIQSFDLTQTGATSSTMLLKWKNGNGSRRVVFINNLEAENIVPLDNATYFANTNFGLGTEIANTGWFCVYNGVEDNVEITGLTGASNYKVAVFEYDGTEGNEKYNQEISNKNIAIVETSIFEEQLNIDIERVIYGTIRWGDYDNDGDLDILRASYNSTSLYRNNGNNTFEEQTDIHLQGVSSGSAIFGDMNNDGLLDIIVSGYSGNTTYTRHTIYYKNNGNNTFSQEFSLDISSPSNCLAIGDYNNDGFLDFIISYYDGVAKKTGIFKNNGNNTFSEQTEISLPDVGNSVSWVDFDNDGDLDIFLTGYSYDEGGCCISKLFKNNGNNTFEKQTNLSFHGLYGGDSKWADFNGDGYIDLLLAGDTSVSTSGLINKLYTNNGDGSFTEQIGTSLPPVGHFDIIETGDYNNDSNIDVLCAGWSDNGQFISKIYKNIGDFKFSEQITISLPGLGEGDACWGDYDNDGDIDFILTGRAKEPGEFVKVYKNLIINDKQIKTENIAPSLPQNVSVSVSGQDETHCSLKFSWNKAYDEETPQNGLSYNVYLGSIAENQEIINSMSLFSGQRKVVTIGNAGPNNFYIINGILLDQQYYFGVQAIDGGYKGSEFSTISNSLSDIPGIPNMKSYIIYPNPASEKIKIDGVITEVQLDIFDLHGHILISKVINRNNEIELSGLTSGTYFVKLKERNNLIVRKLIKK